MSVLGVVVAVAFVAIAGLCWCVYQLLLQTGKLQLRLNAIEKRLYSQGVLMGDLNGVSDGLPLGAVLHDFELPALSGGTRTLSSWRGRKLLMIFFSPTCNFCRDLLPDLAALPEGDATHPTPVIISTGDEDENRSLFSQHAVPHTVLVQRDAEVASLFRVNTAPAAYLVNEEGMTASILYTGADAVLRAAGGTTPQAEAGRRGFSKSLNESRLVRDGLKAGTRAPEFSLPLVSGGSLEFVRSVGQTSVCGGLQSAGLLLTRGEISLASLRGGDVLLIFSDPQCEPCDRLAPRIEEFHRSFPDLQMLMVSRGDEESNRRKIAEHALTFPVARQRYWEISRAYGIFATPVGYWIDAEGILAADVAVGSEAILKLASKAGNRVKQQPTLAAR